MILRLNIILFILSLTVNIYSQDKSLLTKTGDLTYCLDSTEFKLGDFYYGQSKQDINKILGKPDSIRIDEGLSESHYYEGIRFDFNNIGTVYRIAVSSDKYKTPSGIHTGLSRDEVFVILGLKKNEIPSIKYENQFRNCRYEVYFVIDFDNLLIVRQIEIGIDLP